MTLFLLGKMPLYGVSFPNLFFFITCVLKHVIVTTNLKIYQNATGWSVSSDIVECMRGVPRPNKHVEIVAEYTYILFISALLFMINKYASFIMLNIYYSYIFGVIFMCGILPL